MLDLFTGAARKRAYAIMAAIAVIIGAIQVALLTAGYQPKWFDIVIAVFVFLGGSTHAMSAGNVNPAPAVTPDGVVEVGGRAGNALPAVYAEPAVQQPVGDFGNPPAPPGAAH